LEDKRTGHAAALGLRGVTLLLVTLMFVGRAATFVDAHF
jgi:hypothetical protein